MAIKRVVREFCERCGERQAERRGDKIHFWHQCPKVPGKAGPPAIWDIRWINWIPSEPSDAN